MEIQTHIFCEVASYMNITALKNNATTAIKNIGDVCDSWINIRKCHRWLMKLQSGYYGLKNQHSNKRVVISQIYSDQIYSDCRNIFKNSVYGFRNSVYVQMCQNLFQLEKKSPFIQHLVTRDEKWVMYCSQSRKNISFPKSR